MKPKVKVVSVKRTGTFHVALFSTKVVPAKFKYLSLVHTYTKQAGEEWISRLRRMPKKHLQRFVEDAVFQ